MAQAADYRHLTDELEQTGKISRFITVDPEEQAIERQCLIELHNLKKEIELEHRYFVKRLQLIEAGKPTGLMDMSIETVQAMMERVSGKPIETFSELLRLLQSVQESQIVAIVNKENELHPNNHSSLFSPSSQCSSQLLSVSTSGHPATSLVSGDSQYRSNVFPNATEMVNGIPCTPARTVFQFGGISSVMSTNKAPRLLKPGELAFSVSGSPLVMPKLAGLLNKERGTERIPVNDLDGKKIVEVVLYKGEDGTEKEFKEFVTDVRGLVATKSIKKDRIRPPRVPALAKGPAVSSNKKFR